MSRRDGSKRRRGVTAAPFYLGLKAAGNYEADFAVFPQPNMRHLLRQEHAVTSEPFPFSFFDEGGGNIWMFTISDVPSDSRAFFCTHSFEPPKKK